MVEHGGMCAICGKRHAPNINTIQFSHIRVRDEYFIAEALVRT